MSTNLRDLSPIPLPEDKPSNRGRFSDDRAYWEELHERRYLQWQGGDGIEQIAASEGVTYNAVKHSLLWCETRLSPARCWLRTRHVYAFKHSGGSPAGILMNSKI